MTFAIGIFVLFVTAIGVAASPPRGGLRTAAIGGAALVALLIWLFVFRLLFGAAA
ncbi:hypothetical protein [Methylobacterium variabile]|uniref:hypothetical protein n=1 Tax=Methylobacterium variabile TaxID=298794 RepID=UPI000AA786FF|nr:hypothetical protein [Methylobacterium variabile]